MTVREKTTQRILQEHGIKADYMPCPALLSAPVNMEREICKVKRIGLIYQATREESVIWNGCSQELYQYELNLYRDILEQYGSEYEISMVCHYIDELPLARRDFPGIDIYYSYKSEEYFHIYSKYDLVIGPRVHGIGCAASLLIPGISILHDARGETCEGFMADIIQVGTSFETVRDLMEKKICSIFEYNQQLSSHKRNTFGRYEKILRQAMEDKNVVYEGKIEYDDKMFDLKSIDSQLGLVKQLVEMGNLPETKIGNSCQRIYVDKNSDKEVVLNLGEGNVEIDVRKLLGRTLKGIVVDVEKK